MNIISIFGLSDLHLSLSSDKPMDIFRGWDDYQTRIEANWKRMITPDDTVVIPGDISWAMKLEDSFSDFEFLNSLPGTKIILKGNHDLWWNTAKKLREFLDENGFDTIKFIFNSAEVVGDYAICGSRGWFFDDKESSKKVILREAARLDTSITKAKETGKTPLVFLHYPVYFNDQVSVEMLEVLKKHEIFEVWHGHIHGSGKQSLQYSYENIKFNLISCDCIGFEPVLIR